MENLGYTESKHISKMIVTFGKYQGKSVELLMSDKKYHCWLINQRWFQEKYPKMYELIWDNSDVDSLDY